jgi:RNA polymerase-binding transcription factor DksA
MAIKKKPTKSVKKTPPKKGVKPAAKKPVSAKRTSPSKPVKKETHKKNVPVSKKPVGKAVPAKSVSKSGSNSVKKSSAHPAPKKAASHIAHPVSKPAAHHIIPAKPVTHPVAVKPGTHPVAAKPVTHPAVVAKPVPQPMAKAPAVKPDLKKPVFKQEVKNTSPVTAKPEPKKLILPPVRTGKVVIPEMKTKTVRKYEPEFTKSVLDTHQQEQTGPTMRYSDVELGEFRELITKKLESAKKELAYLQGLITRRDEMGGDETDNRYMTMEDGSMSMEREQLSQMASRQITFIDHLEKAMMRIENKTYGICRVTGKLIDKARLKAVPHATLSIEAKQTMNK